MTIIYLYDIEGWALHSIGVWLADSLATPDVTITVMSHAEWRANPVRCDVLYLGYSGIVDLTIDYRQYAGRVVTTVHDPCELSFFEHRDDWAALPLGPLPIAQVDAFSVISEELHDVLLRRYGLDTLHTPTWSPRCESLRQSRREHRDETAPIRVMSSTNMSALRPWRDIARRLAHPGPFLRDERGRFSLGKMASLPVRRRRKRIEWLAGVDAALADRKDIQRDITVGRSAQRSAAEYERSLAATDVYLCTSTMEGGPLPVLEAVMAGAAVLSTRVGQVPRWIEDGGSGFFCATQQEFIDRVRQYADDRDLLRRHQARAREIADQLAPELSGWRKLLAIG